MGQVLGQVGALPDVYSELEVNFFLLRRLLGVRSKEGEKQDKVWSWHDWIHTNTHAHVCAGSAGG